MKIFSLVPFFRLLLPFITGILLGIYAGSEINILWFVILFLSLLLAYLNFKVKLFSKRRFTFWYGNILTFILLLFGYQLTVLNTGLFANNHFSKYQNSSNYQIVRIYRQPVEKEKTIKLFAVAEEVQQHGQWINTKGNILLMLPKDSASSAINYGDRILLKARVEEVHGPKNPDEFNYKKYLSYQSIYHQTYLPKGSWKKMERNGGYKIILLACNMQKKLLAIFKTYIHGKRELAVISALILGDTDGIDSELLYAYAGSGAIHVLSVSGLHVGLIFMVLSWLLFLMDRRQWMKIIKSIFIVCILLFYALLTGLSPAVMCSAVMLTLIIAGATFSRSHNILNSLAISAFGLLVYDPFLIMNVGFLLSYFAMAGIILLHPPIYALYEFNNRITDHIWSASCAAIAAEITTFPLAMLFFHQFPLYFLLSNVIVIFLSTIIMFAGIGLLAISYFVTFSSFLGKSTSFMVYLLNLTVIKITSLPFSTLKNISLSIWETILIYLALILFAAFVIRRNKNHLILVFVLLILVLGKQLYVNYSTRNQKKIIFYSIIRNTAIDLIDGHSATFLANSKMISNFSLTTFHLSSNRGALKVNPSETKCFAMNDSSSSSDPVFRNIHTAISHNQIQFFNKRILILNNLEQLKKVTVNTPIDYLVLSNNIKVTIAELKKNFVFKLLVIDGSNSYYQNKKWLKQCRDINVPVYSLIDLGALIVDLL